MPYDEGLAQRIREFLDEHRGIKEKKMFGGLCFLLNGNMLCGIIGDEFIARLGTDNFEKYLDKPHARRFDFTGKPMKGFVVVSPEGYEDDSMIEFWMKACIEFASSLPPK